MTASNRHVAAARHTRQASREKVAQVKRQLLEHYGPRQPHGRRDPLDELVLTI